MKKIIVVSGILLALANSPLLLVSCKAKEYKDFLTHINNNESFVAMLGADDDNVTKEFDKVKNDSYSKDRFNELMTQTVTDYNLNRTNSGDSHSQVTGWGEEVKSKSLNLYEYKSKESSSLHEEKFAKQIDSWLNDRLLGYWKNPANVNKSSNKDENKDIVKNYLSSLEKSPMFILVRNGKLVWLSNSFTPARKDWHDKDSAIKSIDTWFGYEKSEDDGKNTSLNKEGIYYKFAKDDSVYTNLINAMKPKK